MLDGRARRSTGIPQRRVGETHPLLEHHRRRSNVDATQHDAHRSSLLERVLPELGLFAVYPREKGPPSSVLADDALPSAGAEGSRRWDPRVANALHDVMLKVDPLLLLPAVAAEDETRFFSVNNEDLVHCPRRQYGEGTEPRCPSDEPRSPRSPCRPWSRLCVRDSPQRNE